MAAARAAMAMAGAMAWLNREDGGAGGSGGGGDSVAVEAKAMATVVATSVATLVAMVVARVVARAATRAAAAMEAAEGCDEEESSEHSALLERNGIKTDEGFRRAWGPYIFSGEVCKYSCNGTLVKRFSFALLFYYLTTVHRDFP